MNRAKRILVIFSVSSCVAALFVFFLHVNQQEQTIPQPPSISDDNIYGKNYGVTIVIFAVDKHGNTGQKIDDFLVQNVNGSLEYAMFVGEDLTGKSFAFDKQAKEIYLEIPMNNYPLGILFNETMDKNVNPYFISYTNRTIEGENQILFKIDKDAFTKYIRENSRFVQPILSFEIVTYNIPEIERIQFISQIKTMSCQQLQDWQIQHIGENQDYSDMVHNLISAKCNGAIQ